MMMKTSILTRPFFLTLFVSLITVFSANSQSLAVKTNLLSDALMNINLGGEVALAPQWTLDVEGEFNGWTFSDGKRWKHWAIQPEARYWLCNRFAGHFFGVHVHGGQYNLGGFNGIYNLFGTDARSLENYRYQGWFAGAGLSYGYSWILDKHWNIEAELGLGYSYTRYDKFNCVGCGRKIEENKPHNYVGPTRAAINLVYVF